MPRIDGVPSDTRNPLLRTIFWLVRRRFGRLPEPMRGYARSGAVFASLAALEIGMERAKRVDPRLRGLAELRVASRVGCRFCLDIGSALVAHEGVPEAQLRDLHRYEQSPAFSALEQAVLRYADQMTATPVTIDDALVARLIDALGQPGLVELSSAIAHENLRARLNHALGYGAEGFSEGGTCALPADHFRV